MIIGRTPFRISFTGGGSDIKEFYEKDYGAVVNAAINKYMYIVIHPYFYDKIRIKYSMVEDVKDVEDIKHPIVRECLKKIGIDVGIEITSIADVPAKTGLGSSSAFTICLLHALHAYKGEVVSKEELAKEACEIEIDILKEPIGKQDQFASSFGGINYINFKKNGEVDLSPLLASEQAKRKLKERLLLFYVGGERDARDILRKQKEGFNDSQRFETMKKMVCLSERLRNDLKCGKIDGLGELLHKNWQLKKNMAEGISNEGIDAVYDQAMECGAQGGKLLGAGGAGFLLLYCTPELQDRVRKTLKLKELVFDFDTEGSKIIYEDKDG